MIVEQGIGHVYEFFEPQSIQKSGNKRDQILSYMQNWITDSKTDIYLGAYHHS